MEFKGLVLTFQVLLVCEAAASLRMPYCCSFCWSFLDVNRSVLPAKHVLALEFAFSPWPTALGFLTLPDTPQSLSFLSSVWGEAGDTLVFNRVLGFCIRQGVGWVSGFGRCRLLEVGLEA